MIMGERTRRLINWAASGDPDKAIVPASLTLGNPMDRGNPATVGESLDFAVA